jgi:hypothetical protein
MSSRIVHDSAATASVVLHKLDKRSIQVLVNDP